MTIKVPKEVLAGLEEIRESGLTNMLDYHQVMRLAFDMRHYVLVDWMNDNKKLYVKGIFEGFEAE